MSGEPGELVAIPFPYTNPQTSKRRPVLVITEPDAYGDFIGLPVTSVPAQEHAVPITTEDLAQGQIPKPSWVRYDKVFTLSESAIIKHYGHLGAKVHRSILEGFCHYTGCKA